MKKFKPIGLKDVDLTDGFWADRQKLNAKTTIYAVRDRFRDTGRFEALNCYWRDGMENRPHFFWDSDVAKWMESVAYILAKNSDAELEADVEQAIDLIEKHQHDDGYFNIYFTSVEPTKRFTNRDWHELYDAGHLMEAAVAYYEATGRDRFLKVMCRYADYIERVFKEEKSAAFFTPGHEEIELALVKLYRATGERRYLELSKHFVDQRGVDQEECTKDWRNPKYDQSHMPVREQETAEGHAVRAVYLYSGMADNAYEYEDQSLLDACKKIYNNIVQKRMYITGGIGSSQQGEAFTIDYDLPNLSAYSESCAAIGLAFFSRRLALLDADAGYADTVERVLYNGFLSSQSLDGISFFYENPLEIDPKLHHRDASIGDGTTRFPITQRLEVFGCSCCPPNITRFMASVGDYLYHCSEDTLFVNQYIASEAEFEVGSHQVKISQKTIYPHNGNVKITVQGMKGLELAVRIPGWCQAHKISKAVTRIEKGYAYIDVDSDTFEIEMDFEMPIMLMESAPQVQDNAGRVAVQRGPIVYCLEGVDNGENLRDLHFGDVAKAELEFDKEIGQYTIVTDGGYRRNPDAFPGLYAPAGDRYIPQRLRLIPYFAFANRGETEMIVWIQA